MILAIVRTALTALRRDRASLALSFVLPVAFFSIFATIFGGQHNATPRISVIVVDQDKSSASQALAAGLERETSLSIHTRPSPKNKTAEPPDYTAASAEAAVKSGDSQVALIIPQGFGQNPISFGPNSDGAPAIQLLHDASDVIAPQMV
ncbi:MAG TPA: ABC transporter permease, partial [Bryobacteraceae bacterium]